ncbi:MAG: hypothetical protein R3Y63_04435 [Eubacteriales bacterium]
MENFKGSLENELLKPVNDLNKPTNDLDKPTNNLDNPANDLDSFKNDLDNSEQKFGEKLNPLSDMDIRKTPDSIEVKPKENVSSDSNYREKLKESDGTTQEVHHMPADSISELSRGDGPAIVMEKADHRQTASCGNSLEAREYREQQAELIKEGKFREAVQMDIDDIREKFGDKYDSEIADMEKYLDKLESEGKI